LAAPRGWGRSYDFEFFSPKKIGEKLAFLIITLVFEKNAN
jgi:hypothetical protein